MLLADATAYAPVAAVLASAAAVLGALLGMVKLRGDTDSQAVSQAQGAMETMQDVNDALERERDYWRDRFDKCHADKNELYARVLDLERRAKL